MSNEDYVNGCQKVTGLTLRGYKEFTQIPLTKAYTGATIPVNRSHIPSPEAVAKWSHLSRVVQEIMPVDTKMQVGLSIGYNCDRAFASL